MSMRIDETPSSNVRTSTAQKATLLFLCAGVLCASGCFDQKRPAPHLGPVAFAHPVVPAAMGSATLEDPPTIETESLETAPELAAPPSGPARPHVVYVQPAEHPVVEEKPVDPVILPELTSEQRTAAQTDTQHSLDVAEKNLSETQGKKLNEAQLDVVSKVRGFMEAAREAGKNADWQRARNLAKKAEVLSSELVNE